MATMAPTSDSRESGSHAVGLDSLPEEMNDMKIRDDKVCRVKSSTLENFVSFWCSSCP